MRFGYPYIFYYLLFAVFAGTVFYIWAAKQYRNASTKFAERELLKKIDPYYDDKVLRLRISLNIVAVFFIGIALARPQWGTHWEEKKSRGIDILIALDVSKSMLAQDVAPDRFEFAKDEIRNFVKDLEGDRAGLVAFAGDAFMYCPFTTDYSGFITSLNNIKVGSVSRGGTSIPELITEASRDFKWALSKNKILVIVSDGENVEDDIRKAASFAKSEGIRVFCVGVGTNEGANIPYIDDKGDMSFIKDQSGKVVRSRLEADALKFLASETGGLYALSSREHPGLDFIYEEELSKLKKKEIEEAIAQTYSERFQLPLAIALIALLFEMALSVKKRNEDI